MNFWNFCYNVFSLVISLFKRKNNGKIYATENTVDPDMVNPPREVIVQRSTQLYVIDLSLPVDEYQSHIAEKRDDFLKRTKGNKLI